MDERGGIRGTRLFRVGVAILCCLCANSVSTFSLYGPSFINDLGYTQARLNTVSVIAELAIYLPVPLWGYLCDRGRSGSLAALSAFLYGFGYILAAFTYRSGAPPDSTKGGPGWPFGVMVLAFVGIGGATMCLYLGAIAVCVKAVPTAKSRGLVLALPITSFGLSAVWQSQVGSNFLSRSTPDGTHVELDVFKYFIFLAVLLITVSLLATVAFGFVTSNEESQEGHVHDTDTTDIANEYPTSESTDTQQHNIRDDSENPYAASHTHQQLSQPANGESSLVSATEHSAEDPRQPLLPSKRNSVVKRLDDQPRSSSTFEFLSDRTMHFVAIGFIFLIGPCETYINNVGTVIPALNTGTDKGSRSKLELIAALPESHVSLMALGSTFTRLSAGILSDLSIGSAGLEAPYASATLRFSRMLILLPYMALLLFGFLVLAIPQAASLHPSWLLITSALVGVGYGGGFALIPIIISVVWGLDNFATNWGIVAMLPVGGIGFWSWVYALIYSQHARTDKEGKVQCIGYACYGHWAAGCAASIAVTLMAWAAAWRIWSKRQTKV